METSSIFLKKPAASTSPKLDIKDPDTEEGPLNTSPCTSFPIPSDGDGAEALTQIGDRIPKKSRLLPQPAFESDENILCTSSSLHQDASVLEFILSDQVFCFSLSFFSNFPYLMLCSKFYLFAWLTHFFSLTSLPIYFWRVDVPLRG